VAGLERRRALINGQFMHEMAGEEEDNASFFEEEFNRWLSDDPLDNEEIYKLVHFLKDQRKKLGEPNSSTRLTRYGQGTALSLS
jgi:predicted esterase